MLGQKWDLGLGGPQCWIQGVPILYGMWALGEAWYQLMRFGDCGDPIVGTDKRIWAPRDPAVASENGIEGLWGPQHSDKGVWEPGDPRIGSWATEDPNIS